MTTCIQTVSLVFTLTFVHHSDCIGNAIFGNNFSLPDWCYNNDTCDEATWYDECKASGHQSPIDLPADLKSIHTKHESIKDFPKSEMSFPGFEMEYLGYTIRVRPGGEPVHFKRKIHHSESVKYTFYGFDMHWGSRDDIGAEHTIGGKSYGGEIHLMFYDEEEFNPETTDRLPSYTGEKDFLVIAVFLDVEHDGYQPTTNFLEPIVESLENMTTRVPNTVEVLLNLQDLFRGTVAYKYPGSFTTPGCRELEWWILRKPVVIPKSHIKALRHAKVDGHPMEMDNFRRQKGEEPTDISLVKFHYV